MATSISDYDLFSLVESLINEEEVSADSLKQQEKEFIEDSERQKVNAPKKTKGTKKKDKNKINSKKSSSKKEEEETDLVDKETEDDNEEVETPDESPTTLKLADALDYKNFVDDMNKFRAAHSFDDPDISKELEDYFQKLEDDEKKVFYIILKGLIQVTLMGVDGKTARTPSELKFSIKKSGNVTSEKKRSMQRKIDVSKELNDKDVKDKKVDTNTPIKIGESRQNKDSIYRVIKENK